MKDPVAMLLSAAVLHNGKIALTLASRIVILFRYAEEKVSDLKWLAFKSNETFHAYVFPVSEERFLTINDTSTGVFLQYWNSETGEQIGGSFELPINFCKYKPQLLPDGSILGYGEYSQICIINGKTKKPEFYDMGCYIREAILLTNERILIVTHANLNPPLGKTFNVHVMELEHLFKMKRGYINQEILTASTLALDTINLVAEYVGSDIFIPTRLGLFSLPKTPIGKIQDSIKSFRPTIIDLIKLFAGEDLECLELAVRLRKEIEAPRINTGKFESALDMFRERFDKIKIQLSDTDQVRLEKQYVLLHAEIENLKTAMIKEISATRSTFNSKKS